MRLFLSGLFAALLLALGAAWWFNGPWLGHPQDRRLVLAHRGVHQDYPREGLTNETCTAARIFKPTHAFLENTLPSMDAAFRAGADIIEIDIHPTTDGQFVVFHDWRLECRTDGRGVTREHSLKDLQKLDIGFGYTPDEGRTFPFRGSGAVMPSLDEVLRAFPGRRFLVNVKSDDPAEGELIAAWLEKNKALEAGRLAFYGGQRPIDRLLALRPDLRTTSRRRIEVCLGGYLLKGWRGETPPECRRGILFVPVNARWLMWGWPDLFLERMQKVDAEVFVSGPIGWNERGLNGLDDPTELNALSRWKGGIATDRVEEIGPAYARR